MVDRCRRQVGRFAQHGDESGDLGLRLAGGLADAVQGI
jgi:hypothetical protein